MTISAHSSTWVPACVWKDDHWTFSFYHIASLEGEILKNYWTKANISRGKTEKFYFFRWTWSPGWKTGNPPWFSPWSWNPELLPPRPPMSSLFTRQLKAPHHTKVQPREPWVDSATQGQASWFSWSWCGWLCCGCVKSECLSRCPLGLDVSVAPHARPLEYGPSLCLTVDIHKEPTLISHFLLFCRPSPSHLLLKALGPTVQNICGTCSFAFLCGCFLPHSNPAGKLRHPGPNMAAPCFYTMVNCSIAIPNCLWVICSSVRTSVVSWVFPTHPFLFRKSLLTTSPSLSAYLLSIFQDILAT